MLVEMPVVVYKLSEYDNINNITLDTDVLSKIDFLKEMYSRVQQNNDNGYNKKKKSLSFIDRTCCWVAPKFMEMIKRPRSCWAIYESHRPSCEFDLRNFEKKKK